jgi:hypothetical protein
MLLLGISAEQRRLDLAIANGAPIAPPRDAVNADPKPFKWTKSADDILAAIKRFCLKTLQIAAAQAEIARNSESGY